VILCSFAGYGFQYPESDYFPFLAVISTHLGFQVSSSVPSFDCSMRLNSQLITKFKASLEWKLPFHQWDQAFYRNQPARKEEEVRTEKHRRRLRRRSE
jgi:hypothetical protein